LNRLQSSRISVFNKRGKDHNPMQHDDVGGSGLAIPSVMLDIGITGHRSKHPVFSANRAGIAKSLTDLIAFLGRVANEEADKIAGVESARLQLHSLLAYGADLMAVKCAKANGWPVAAPLPFGRALNLAINAQPETLADMDALLVGEPAIDVATAARAKEIAAIASEVNLFELAEQDAEVGAFYRAHLAAPDDEATKQAFVAICSDRAAMAARVMVEHSDLVIGIWDGVTRGNVGGTRHTIEAALEQGVSVIWIDARNPDGWRILRAAEELAGIASRSAAERDESAVRAAVHDAMHPSSDGWKSYRKDDKWHAKSSPLFQAYRRVEALFGEPANRPFRSLRQRYEHPDAIATGTGAPMMAAMLALPGGDPVMPQRIANDVFKPFAWADGISTWLSDAYRGGMVASFFLSAFAIIGGVAYLPVASVEHKWGFAAFEFLLLAMIVVIFLAGKRLRWHERWFETRRVAEYFRHAPIMLLLGASRSTGRWPRGQNGNWPEWYARNALRGIGLPQMKVTSEYLRCALTLMRDHHVSSQRAYHLGKAARLKRAQHNLDRSSELLFLLAVISVAVYLMIETGAALNWFPHGLPHDVAKAFTFLGVLFPTLGGALAGVHYFGDFERFSAISEITAQKLGDVDARIGILLDAPDSEITYVRVSGLAHAIDDIVVDEIENWQAVFGGKHITVPV
jgi:hypothetical protein